MVLSMNLLGEAGAPWAGGIQSAGYDFWEESEWLNARNSIEKESAPKGGVFMSV